MRKMWSCYLPTTNRKMAVKANQNQRQRMEISIGAFYKWINIAVR